MRKTFLPFNRPNIESSDCQAVLESLQSLWLTTGPKAKRFEEQFCELTRAEGALALNSCTAGLHLGLKALGVVPGDEVITTPLTFCATANVIEHLGATTVLADIDAETCLISPRRIAEKISNKTKVILPVHYAGQTADMVEINALAKENNLFVLEDCAHCLPNFYKDGTPVGGGGNLCSFSFYANKNITTGEGGMLTGPSDLVENCRALSLHGMNRDAWKRFDQEGSWRYDVVKPGFKYNMTDMQAALGLSQLARFDLFFENRKKIAQFYTEALREVEEVRVPSVKNSTSFHIFPIVIDSLLNRDVVVERMKQKNIGVSVHYLPIHQFSYYKEKYRWVDSDFPAASRVGNHCMTLPLYSSLTTKDLQDVVEAVKTSVKGL